MKISIGLLGFGRTGSIVANEIIKDDACYLNWVLRRIDSDEWEFASHLLGYKHKEGKIFSNKNLNIKEFLKNNPVDVIIDFSSSNAIDYYRNAADLDIKIVSAISNYDQDQITLLKELSSETAILHSPNITLGVNFLITASKLFKIIEPNADIEIIEEHFKDKKSVSGTALKIAEELGIDKEKCINSIRIGGVVGKHEVIFGLPYQTIRITHESISRAAFGQGAIYASKWIINKCNGLYNMTDISI